jgi:hypothetical protein
MHVYELAVKVLVCLISRLGVPDIKTWEEKHDFNNIESLLQKTIYIFCPVTLHVLG